MERLPGDDGDSQRRIFFFSWDVLSDEDDLFKDVCSTRDVPKSLMVGCGRGILFDKFIIFCLQMSKWIFKVSIEGNVVQQ